MDEHPAGVPKQKSSTTVIVIVVGVLAMIAAGLAYCSYGVGQYRDVARSIGVVVTVETIGTAMQGAHERNGKLCPSTDAAKPVDEDPGWKCMAVSSMILDSTPGFTYSVSTSGDAFTVRAEGKYPEDDARHEYVLEGKLEGGEVVVGKISSPTDSPMPER